MQMMSKGMPNMPGMMKLENFLKYIIKKSPEK